MTTLQSGDGHWVIIDLWKKEWQSNPQKKIPVKSQNHIKSDSHILIVGWLFGFYGISTF